MLVRSTTRQEMCEVRQRHYRRALGAGIATANIAQQLRIGQRLKIEGQGMDTRWMH